MVATTAAAPMEMARGAADRILALAWLVVEIATVNAGRVSALVFSTKLTSQQRAAAARTRQSSDSANWQEQAERLREMFADPYYTSMPIRPTTVAKAAEYATELSANDTCGIFPGRHAFLGGAMDDRDGVIYGIPSHARSIVCLYPTSKHTDKPGYQVRTIPLPSSVAGGKFKWLRGILADGYLYGIPAWADCVLQVDIDALWNRRPTTDNAQNQDKENLVNLLPLPDSYKDRGQQWQWHGAALNKDSSAIYCIPSNAKQVLKVDLKTFATSLIDIDIPKQYTNCDLNLTNKWYGGILGHDNAVYGVPYRTGSVLRIDATTDTATLVGPDFGADRWNWHGGIEANGSIYAFPSHADTVLKIDTTEPSCGRTCTRLPISRPPTDTEQQYKWLGGAKGADGNIYGMSCDASSILKVNVETDECSAFGDTGNGKSKWQGAVLADDGHVYAIPSYGRHVLRIDTRPKNHAAGAINEENRYQLIGDLPFGKSKYQGGFVGKGGAIYCIPENGYRVLRVTPSKVSDNVQDGSLPLDVKVDMM